MFSPCENTKENFTPFSGSTLTTNTIEFVKKDNSYETFISSSPKPLEEPSTSERINEHPKIEMGDYTMDTMSAIYTGSMTVVGLYIVYRLLDRTL